MTSSLAASAAAAAAASKPAASVLLSTFPLGLHWPTSSPFLFCAHHLDDYPSDGDGAMGTAPADRRGRRLGMDFEGKDGFRMYHGETVPGFPGHPHRGFETVTLVRTGLCDHHDSLGACARFGNGDVQWVTTGAGVQHSEMFPLVEKAPKRNPLELFQIWLNLPRASKMVPPHFTMFWAEKIPHKVFKDLETGKEAEVVLIAGAWGDAAPAGAGSDSDAPLPPPPDSYAAKPEADVAIWTVSLQPGARCVLPPAKRGTKRTLYYFEGEGLRVGPAGEAVGKYTGFEVRSDIELPLVASEASAGQVLVLQGRPIDEPVAQRGPFVMNTQAELQQTMIDYQRTQFGGWPWPSDDPVHPRETGRFARFPDGTEQRPGSD